MTDKNSHEYALKVFTYSDELAMGHKERRLYDYANERTYLVNITRNACPELLDALADKSLFGKTVACANHHIQLLLGLDVPVFDKQGAQVLGTVKLPIASSTGDESNRVLDFTANTLLPYMAGGRLNDIVGRVPRYQSMVVRYPLYVDVAPQIVEAVRYLHSIHIAHLGIQTSAILCSNIECEDAILADPSVAWNGQGKASPYANELMQQSVRFSQFTTRDHSGESEQEHEAHTSAGEMTAISKTFASYLNSTDWEAATKVDWYGLGGSLFYILSGIRPVAEDRAGPNSHDTAEFIYKALQSKQLLNKIPDEESKKALMKIRDQVAEGLLLVDGLLQTDRSKRISFDLSPVGLQRMQRTANNLRSSKALMSSALQLGSQSTTGQDNSCAKFISESTKASQTLAELPVQDKESFPSFLQQICQ